MYLLVFMTTITSEKIVEIHDYVITTLGGAGGIICLGTIEHLIFELDEGADVFEKAAIILHRIITRHPFMDGHKRTAFQVADNILRDEGYHIHTDKLQIEKFLIKIAKYEYEIEEINKWLKKKCMRPKKGQQLQLSQAYH